MNEESESSLVLDGPVIAALSLDNTYFSRLLGKINAKVYIRYINFFHYCTYRRFINVRSFIFIFISFLSFSSYLWITLQLRRYSLHFWNQV